ncbi:MAG: hypothetical protein ACRBDL_00395 [Alphaproteobacteria bacterium]
MDLTGDFIYPELCITPEFSEVVQEKACDMREPLLSSLSFEGGHFVLKPSSLPESKPEEGLSAHDYSALSLYLPEGIVLSDLQDDQAVTDIVPAQYRFGSLNFDTGNGLTKLVSYFGGDSLFGETLFAESDKAQGDEGVSEFYITGSKIDLSSTGRFELGAEVWMVVDTQSFTQEIPGEALSYQDRINPVIVPYIRAGIGEDENCDVRFGYIPPTNSVNEQLELQEGASIVMQCRF